VRTPHAGARHAKATYVTMTTPLEALRNKIMRRIFHRLKPTLYGAVSNRGDGVTLHQTLRPRRGGQVPVVAKGEAVWNERTMSQRCAWRAPGVLLLAALTAGPALAQEAPPAGEIPEATAAETAPPTTAPAGSPEGTVVLLLPPGVEVVDSNAVGSGAQDQLLLVEGAQPVKIRIQPAEGAAVEQLVTEGQLIRLRVGAVSAAAPAAGGDGKAPLLPEWFGTTVRMPWAVAGALLSGAALAGASLLLTVPVRTLPVVGSLPVTPDENLQRAAGIAVLVGGLAAAAASVGLILLPLLLERTGVIAPA